MKMGLISTTKEALNPAVKAQAAYALILEQSTTAQGDFARTSDGLANQQRIMNAEWENAQAALGQTLLPAMTKAVSVLNDLLSGFNSLPQPVKSVALGVAAVSAALILLAPRIAATRAAMIELGITSKITGARLASFGKFAGIATVALVGMTVAVSKINESAADAVPSVDSLTKGLTDLARTGKGVLTSASDETVSFTDALNRLTDPSLNDRLWDFWGFLGSGGDAGPELVAMRKYIENIDAALVEMVNRGNAEAAAAAFALMAKDAEAQGRSLDDVKSLLPGYTAAVDSAGKASSTAAGGVAAVGDAADDANKEVDDLRTALDKLRGSAQTVDEANAALEQSFDDAAQAAKDMKGGLNATRTALDLNTQAGRDGQAALAGIVDAAYDTAEAMGEAGRSTKDIRDRTLDARIAFIKTATEMGLTKDAAKALADKYGLIPQRIATKVKVNRAEALAAVADVKAAIASIPSVKNVKIDIQAGTQGTGGGRRTTTMATGGHVRGPGSGTSDSIPARLSNGEYVVRARSVRKYGTAMLGAINEGRYASGGLVQGFASGGYASTGTTGATAGGALLSFAQASRPIVLKMDSTEVWRGLLSLKRSRGGASLGLS
jgi:methyl-accepting chemotaxis protein/copper chaperone CopZ